MADVFHLTLATSKYTKTVDFLHLHNEFALKWKTTKKFRRISLDGLSKE